jgi:hypothetical protein
MESTIEDVYGKKYRVRLIPAYHAQNFLDHEPVDGSPPCEESVIFLMGYVDAKVEGEWFPLEDAEAIDKYVDGWVELDKLVEIVYNVNFGFLQGWRVWRIPNTDGFEGTEPRQLSPFIHSIITNGFASLQELKTSCSLKDAFEMQDSILTKAMNEYRYMKMKGAT